MPNDLRSAETVEVLSPLQRRRRVRRILLYSFTAAVAALGLAIVAGTLAVGAYPSLRQRLTGWRPGPREFSITTTPPGAEVYLDETPAGTSPVCIEAERGSHELRIVLTGFKTWRQPIEVANDEALDITLERLDLATLIVETDPRDAQVFLHDEHRGNFPLTIAHLTAGTYTLRVQKALCLPATQEVELKPGETKRVVLNLKSNDERFYLEAIEAAPNSLANYTELLHLYVLRQDAEKARDVTAKALAILGKAEATATELRQFVDELTKILNGQVGTLPDDLRAKVVEAMIGLLEKAIVANPSTPSSYRSIVSHLGKAKQFEKIQALCEKLAANPKIGTQATLYIAEMYLDWDEPKSAIMLLQPAVKQSPTTFHLHSTLAKAYHDAERLDDALAEYAEAAKLMADLKPYYQARVHVGMARILAARKDLPTALAAYEKALALGVDPEYSTSWRFLYAQTLVQAGRPKDAIAQYQKIEETAAYAKHKAIARKARLELEAATAPKPEAKKSGK